MFSFPLTLPVVKPPLTVPVLTAPTKVKPLRVLKKREEEAAKK
jgi:hypothetical protein